MSFPRNKGLAGVTVGLINRSDGSAVTTGTPTAYVTKDGGAQAAIADVLVHKGNGQWAFDLSDQEMDAGLVGIVVTHPDAIPVHFTLVTTLWNANDVYKLLEADKRIDVGTSPWQLVHIERGTGTIGVGTELLRQDLADVSGAGVEDTETVIGQVVSI